MTYSYERKTIVSTTEILIGEEDPPQENNICISSLHVCSQNKKDVSLQSIASLLLAFDIKVCSRWGCIAQRQLFSLQLAAPGLNLSSPDLFMMNFRVQCSEK